MRVDRPLMAQDRARRLHERPSNADLVATVEQAAAAIPQSLARRYMLKELGGLVKRHSERIAAALRLDPHGRLSGKERAPLRGRAVPRPMPDEPTRDVTGRRKAMLDHGENHDPGRDGRSGRS